jgi:general secretion pathway protein E
VPANTDIRDPTFQFQQSKVPSLNQNLGDLLVAQGKLDPEKLQQARRLERDNGERLGPLLVQLGMLAERDLAEILAQELDLELAHADAYPQTPAVPGRVTPEFLKQSRAVPLEETEEHVLMAMADPQDRFTTEAIELALGKPVEAQVGIISEIESAIQRQYSEGAGALAQIAGDYDADGQNDIDDIQYLKDLASEAPIIRLVNLLISRALKQHASDIHIEPFDNTLKVRYRVDGILREVEAPPVRSTAAVVSRIKVMANLNIAERRLPQDGRIMQHVEGREIDMRVSTVPTMHGESVVMRILDKGSLPLEFASLGFDAAALAAFEEILLRPQGIILVTGPTGSGKTTTLYAALHALNTPDKKILTVEDPVEYQLAGTNQIQVKPQIGLSFANALRSILRQDPDIIMIGEMRDLETAKIAVQAALTGHKVLSTLHTNDSASSVTRMLDMGVEDFLLTSTVNGVLSQRLVRVLCEHCKESYEIGTELAEELGLARFADTRGLTLYRGAGCESCDGSGYRGRTCILELLVMSDAVRQCILAHGDAAAIHAAAAASGTISMHEDGLRKALAGITSLEEVERVTREA